VRGTSCTAWAETAAGQAARSRAPRRSAIDNGLIRAFTIGTSFLITGLLPHRDPPAGGRHLDYLAGGVVHPDFSQLDAVSSRLEDPETQRGDGVRRPVELRLPGAGPLASKRHLGRGPLPDRKLDFRRLPGQDPGVFPVPHLFKEEPPRVDRPADELQGRRVIPNHDLGAVELPGVAG